MIPEQNVELFLNKIIKNTEFSGKTFSVGGYVRDEILGIEPKDLDIVVEIDGGSKAITSFIFSTFPNLISAPIQMGKNYPIWQITFKENIIIDGIEYKTSGAIIEFADTMKESFLDSQTRQRSVEFASLEEDIKRRDLTCNMLVKDLSTMNICDITGTSIYDVANGILRGHPKVDLNKILSDDPLRLLRIVRFYCKYGWKMPFSVVRCIKINANRINIVSKERIINEIEKMTITGNFYKGMRLMKITGLLKEILPEIESLSNVEQGIKYHFEGNAWKHTVLVMKNANPTFIDQMAALFHDIGKQYTYDRQENEKVTFYNHDKVGERVSDKILKELKLDNKTSEKIAKIVGLHMRPHFLHSQEFRKKPLIKFIRDCGEELEYVLNLANADCLGMIPTRSYIDELKTKISLLGVENIENRPILNGKEIMDILKIQPGPIIRDVNRFLIDLYDEYFERSEKLTKEIAIERIKERFKNAK